MTLHECYDAMGANYDEVQGRLRTDERIQKFLLRLPADPSYGELCSALANRQIEDAFRAAHTLKGVSQNLALTPLYHSAATLCDALRGKQDYDPSYEALLAAVQADYAAVTDCIAKLSAG
jgi:HPt (histidine-containing phosphotransfer) domain-containing protein